MARNQPTSDDPFYRRSSGGRRYTDDALPLDAGLTEDDGEEDEQQFRRASRRVPVRKGKLASRTAARVRLILGIVLTLAVLGGGGYETYTYLMTSARFRVTADDSIEVLGDTPNAHAQIVAQMHGLVGRNIFKIALNEQKQSLERIPWVESAAVARLWPNHLRVMVKERTPVAFAALPDRVVLVDANGILMDNPPGRNFSFPVMLNMSEAEPLSTRAARVKLYTRLIRELDNGPGVKVQYSRDVEEVDLSDPEDVRVLAKGGSAPVLLHMGTGNYYSHFVFFLSNVQKWEQEHGKLRSVDLRYEPQVILNPDTASPAPPAAAAAPAAEAKAQDKPQEKKKHAAVAKKPAAKKTVSNPAPKAALKKH
ncbi:MAG: FtsQ-type POTRA domain-containing protein [Acidobacteriota bacterium]|nr:FtsQ-type POTRA domain-containing protein [Acidobacteriota bacterium]